MQQAQSVASFDLKSSGSPPYMMGPHQLPTPIPVPTSKVLSVPVRSNEDAVGPTSKLVRDCAVLGPVPARCVHSTQYTVHTCSLFQIKFTKRLNLLASSSRRPPIHTLLREIPTPPIDTRTIRLLFPFTAISPTGQTYAPPRAAPDAAH